MTSHNPVASPGSDPRFLSHRTLISDYTLWRGTQSPVLTVQDGASGAAGDVDSHPLRVIVTAGNWLSLHRRQELCVTGRESAWRFPSPSSVCQSPPPRVKGEATTQRQSSAASSARPAPLRRTGESRFSFLGPPTSSLGFFPPAARAPLWRAGRPAYTLFCPKPSRSQQRRQVAHAEGVHSALTQQRALVQPKAFEYDQGRDSVLGFWCWCFLVLISKRNVNKKRQSMLMEINVVIVGLVWLVLSGR